MTSQSQKPQSAEEFAHVNTGAGYFPLLAAVEAYTAAIREKALEDAAGVCDEKAERHKAHRALLPNEKREECGIITLASLDSATAIRALKAPR